MKRDICTLFTCVCGLTAFQPAFADDPPVDDATPQPAGPQPQPAPEPAPEPAPAPSTTLASTAPPVEAPTVPSTTYDTESPGQYSYAWREPRMYSEIGINISLGGGFMGFTSGLMRDTASQVGGLWGLRASFGTHVPLGLEVAYVGTASSVETFSGLDLGTLIGTTLEGTLRYNILPHSTVNPYLFGGIGWQHYDLTDSEIPTSDSGMRGSDDLTEFPLGVGLAVRSLSGFTFDARGTFRAAMTSDLLIDEDGDEADLHTWEASASFGYEF